jgi:mono/diheme cytochrome c family protein
MVVCCAAVVRLPAAQDDVKTRKTVRDAVYTAAQAERGKQVYEANCVNCHLAELDGSANPTAAARGAPLVGTRFVQDFGEAKVSALFNKMKRDMPSGRPGTLTDQQYLDVATYVLQRNSFPAGSAELTEEVADSTWIPGAGGADGLQNYTLVSAAGCLHQDSSRSWLLTDAGRLTKKDAGLSEGRGEFTFRLLDAISYNPEALSGRHVRVTGHMVRLGAEIRVNVASLEAAGGACGKRVGESGSQGTAESGSRGVMESGSLGVVESGSLKPQTVWSGVYTEAQAFRGEKVADTSCIGCHGSNLDGGDSGPRLVGAAFLENWSSQSAAELFTWLQEAMPADAPGTLSKPDTAAVLAYILKLNKMPSGKQELPIEPDALKRITILAGSR